MVLQKYTQNRRQEQTAMFDRKANEYLSELKSNLNNNSLWH